MNRALPFGLRSALKIFTAVADMIAWVLHRAGIQDQYLNDFLFSGPPPATDVAARHTGGRGGAVGALGYPPPPNL